VSYQYIIFPDPLDARCTLHHDIAGWTLIGVPTLHPTGRPGQGFTIPDGTPPDNGIELTIAADGYYDFRQRGLIRLHADGTATTEMDDFRLTRKGHGSAGMGRLQPDGNQFVRYTWAMMTGFCDFQLWLTGRQADCRALWSQARELGANGRRVFGMMHYITHFYPQEHPNYLSELQPFARAAAEYGQRIHFDVFADNQEVRLGESFWQQVRGQLEPIESVLLGLGNEWPKNGFDPHAFSRPGVIASQGSTTADAAPPMAGWGVRMWHGRRDYPKVWISAEDMFFVGMGIESSGHQYAPVAPVVHDEPIGFAEVNIPGRRSTDPRLAQSLMLTGRAFGAGATFHCEDGMFSRLLGPQQQVCARAFFDAQ
jgi:hypothetical protein